MFKSFLQKSLSLTTKPTRSFKFIQDRLPVKYEPYYRLGRYDKQIGTLLLYIPCTWGIAIAQPYFLPLEFIKYAGLTYIGAIVSRSAGCIVNDLWDQDFDKKVKRTKTRPLASGELTPKQAGLFFIPHVMVGLSVLSQLNLETIKWTLAIVPVAALYPAAKRVTSHPQVVLGTAFNWGVWVGYAAVHGAVDYATCGSLYAAGICWTLIYDTIYAHQDKEDDKMIGVKSTALAWGERTKEISHYLNYAMFGLLMGAGYSSGIGAIYYPLIAANTFFMRDMIKKVDIDNRESCNNFFVRNRVYGFMILLSIILGKIQLSVTN